MAADVAIEKPASVRLAVPADEAAVYASLVELWRFNGSGWQFPYSPLVVLTTIESATRPDPATRTDPTNQRRGIIGVIDGHGGRFDGIVGIFLDRHLWFSESVIPVELFLFVRPGARNRRRLERDLAHYAEWVHDKLRPDPATYKDPFMLATGFMFVGSERRFAAMARLWRLLFRGARPVGMLFWRD